MGGAEPVQVRRLAMDYLARREHSATELIDKLMQRGVEQEMAAHTVDTLSQEGLQDDQRFAEMYLRSQVARGKGPHYVRNSLRQRDLPSHLIESVVGQADVDWWELAEQVVVKKYPAGPCDAKERAARLRFMQSRGFTGEQSSAALSVLGRSDESDDF